MLLADLDTDDIDLRWLCAFQLGAEVVIPTWRLALQREKRSDLSSMVLVLVSSISRYLRIANEMIASNCSGSTLETNVCALLLHALH